MSVYHNQNHQPDKQIILVELWQIGHQTKIWCLVAPLNAFGAYSIASYRI